MSAITWIKNGEFQARLKHIDIKYKFIVERYQAEKLHVKHEPSKTQLADILTKPLSNQRFENLREEIGVMKINRAQ